MFERWSNFLLQRRENSRINQADENLISLVRLNPVTVGDESIPIKRGLFSIMKKIDELLISVEFKNFLQTDATTEDGEQKVLTHFNVDDGHWQELLTE